MTLAPVALLVSLPVNVPLSGATVYPVSVPVTSDGSTVQAWPVYLPFEMDCPSALSCPEKDANAPVGVAIWASTSEPSNRSVDRILLTGDWGDILSQSNLGRLE